MRPSTMFGGEAATVAHLGARQADGAQRLVAQRQEIRRRMLGAAAQA